METLSHPTETKAIKEHRCSFCNQKIVVGEKYLRSTHVHDGGIYNWKSHKHCSKLAERLNMYAECDEGLTSDDFMEIVGDTHQDILSKKIPKNLHKECSDIFGQLYAVPFRDKLWYVMGHLNKLDKEKLNRV